MIATEFYDAMSLCDAIREHLATAKVKALFSLLDDARRGREVDAQTICRLGTATAIDGRGPYWSEYDPVPKIVRECATDAVRHTAQIILSPPTRSPAWLLREVEANAAKALATLAASRVYDQIGEFVVSLDEVKMRVRRAIGTNEGWYHGQCPPACLAATREARDDFAAIIVAIRGFATDFYDAWPGLRAELDRDLPAEIPGDQAGFLLARDRLLADARCFQSFLEARRQDIRWLAHEAAWRAVVKRAWPA